MGESEEKFGITVEGFSEGGEIPSRFTCDGGDKAPAVHWSGEPSETRSFALIMDDPDAPHGTWNHWLVWDVPAHVHSLREGAAHASVGITGTNDFGRLGYGGPCPPKGAGPHRYFFRLFALDTSTIGVHAGAKRPAVEKAIKKHAIAETAQMGRYERG